MNTKKYEKAIGIIKKSNNIIRTQAAIKAGIHPLILYSMRDNGIITQISRGVYKLTDSAPLGNPDLVTVCTRINNGVICLISALSFHGITTQIPHQVHIALPKGAEEPRIKYPPITTFRFSSKAYSEGI